MYITDSVTVDATSPFQVLKRLNRENQGDEENVENKFKARWGEETVECSDRAKRHEETARKGTRSTKTDEIIQKQEHSELDDINELANSILEDDESFEEDLFALDTEKQSNRRSRIKEMCPNDKSANDKSRVTETQLTFVDDDRKTEIQKEIMKSYFRDKSLIPQSNAIVSSNEPAVRCSDEKVIKSEKCERSCISDSQPFDKDLYEHREDLVGVNEKIEFSGRLRETNVDPDANVCTQDRNQMMAPLGFKNSKVDRVMSVFSSIMSILIYWLTSSNILFI